MPPAPRCKVLYENQDATGVMKHQHGTRVTKSSYSSIKSLFLVRLRLVVDDREVAQLVGVLVAGDYVEVVAQLLLLQVLLGEVLQVTFRKRRLGGYGDARLQKRREEENDEACFLVRTTMVNSFTRRTDEIPFIISGCLVRTTLFHTLDSVEEFAGY